MSAAHPLLRVYSPEECTEPGKGRGYPHEWDRCFGCLGSGCARCEGAGSIKNLIRQWANQRCVRCLHPYRKGEHGNGEWSPCDEQCRHGGPARYLQDDGTWTREQMPDREGLPMLVGLRPVEARWRILTVHHLNEVKSDCRWWNLVALCQRCHLNVQRRVKLDQPWPFEHAEWFKPYAAGFYASSILGEELPRDETTERLEELLALEHRQDRLPGVVAA